jgi:hypothetical protein
MRKKNSPSQSSTSPSVKLTRDDVEEILEILTGVCKRIEIEDDKFEYDSLDELEQKGGKKIERLILSGVSPYISLKVREDGFRTKLFASGDDSALAPYLKIKGILERRKRKLLHFLFSIPIGIILWCIFSLAIFLILGFSPIPVAEWVKVCCMYFVGFIFGALHYFTNVGRFTLVTLNRKNERKSFWARNKEKLLLTLLTIALTAILTFIVTYLLFK